jgi:hypothetical protein
MPGSSWPPRSSGEWPPSKPAQRLSSPGVTSGAESNEMSWAGDAVPPESGNPISADQKTRRLLVNRFPYQAVYRVRHGEIVIVALAHLKRRPGYWKHRE